MRWGNLAMIWLVVGPIVVVLAFTYGHLIRRRLVHKAGKHKLVQRLLETFSLERRLFKQLLIFLGLVAVTLAALRPQQGRMPEPIRQTGIDVAVAFDISKSMLARDVQPSRLDGARDQLNQLLELMVGHRVALVPFAGIAFTQSPLTADKSAVRLYLDSLNPRQMPVGGTNLAMAINEGVKLLTGREDRGDRSTRSRILLLITDGEEVADTAGEAVKEAARKAAEAGITIYAVAVGTRLGEPIPILNSDGTHAGYQRDSAGKPIYSKLNMTLLEDIVRLASPDDPDRTRVFQFDGQTPVAPVLAKELDTLRKTTLKSTVRHKHREKFQYVLIFGVLLLLVDLFIGERRKRKEPAV